MDCNKDEAMRAKTIAEEKLQESDFTGAEKFAFKAQNLYPNLEGLMHLFAILNMMVASTKKICADLPDLYAVLDSEPLSDKETLKKKYKKLALILHPDKNKVKGAGEAFKILLNAWTTLSDEDQKASYDNTIIEFRRDEELNKKLTTMRTRGDNECSSSSQTRQPQQTNTDSVFPFDLNETPVDECPQQTTTTSNQRSSSFETFYMMCSGCNSQLEFLRKFKNQTIQCRICHHLTLAKEMPFWETNLHGKCSWPSGSRFHPFRRDGSGTSGTA